MKVLVTGANGFIGKNLVLRLRERADTEVLTLTRSDGDSAWQAALAQADAVVHLAGENRPTDPAAFDVVNTGLTQRLCDT
jgi:UDP-2-acetamido-2,6-beta-L-arabino-hexul-4-ose reductase